MWVGFLLGFQMHQQNVWVLVYLGAFQDQIVGALEPWGGDSASVVWAIQWSMHNAYNRKICPWWAFFFIGIVRAVWDRVTHQLWINAVAIMAAEVSWFLYFRMEVQFSKSNTYILKHYEKVTFLYRDFSFLHSSASTNCQGFTPIGMGAVEFKVAWSVLSMLSHISHLALSSE